MTSLLNADRPPVFCPGCAHERIVHALDQALGAMGLGGQKVALVSDIGCSGLFDTFFNTHALHGLHGRALTYATGIKLVRPELNVVVTMGDGGLGIGGAHVLSTCRRNIGITLLVLNNFNYGMTGGQCSATTPPEAVVGSAFLNRLEKPLDICQVAAAAGAGFVARISAYDAGLAQTIRAAMQFDGFALLDIWGLCTGRYSRRNRLTPQVIESQLAQLPTLEGYAARNARPEYGRAYRAEAAKTRAPQAPERIQARFEAGTDRRQELVLLGSAGQRIVTAGELLCLSGALAGRWATQKNDYPITVMRGHSVSEVILSAAPVGYSGIQCPTTVLALAREGVNRRQKLLSALAKDSLVIKAAGVDIPATAAQIWEIDFKARQIKPQDWALAAVAVAAAHERVPGLAVLEAALALRFDGDVLKACLELVARASTIGPLPAP
jgi:pyruvate/2-oxoacid:ferredoxin oxidoreductase beta subunit